MSETKSFHLGDILSITTERLVSPRHVDGIYDILNFMTGDNLFTHQLPRAGRECKGPLLDQHPELTYVEVPDDFGGSEEAVNEWLAEQVLRYGEYLDVAPLDPEDHTYIDPFTELQLLVPDAQIIVVQPPEGDSS